VGPGTFEGLFVILVAVVPGYIALALWARNKTWQVPPTDLKYLLLAIVVSAVIQLLEFLPLTSWWVWPVHDHLVDHPIRVAFWGLFALLLIPAIGGLYAGRLTSLWWGTLFWGKSPPSLRTREGWRRVLFEDLFPPVPPSPWDKFFLEDTADGQFLVITFNDGSKVAGSYYGPAWVAMSPQTQGIFLAQEYTIKDGQIGREITESKGVLVPVTSNIASVKVLAAASDAEEAAK